MFYFAAVQPVGCRMTTLLSWRVYKMVLIKSLNPTQFDISMKSSVFYIQCRGAKYLHLIRNLKLNTRCLFFILSIVLLFTLVLYPLSLNFSLPPDFSFPQTPFDITDVNLLFLFLLSVGENISDMSWDNALHTSSAMLFSLIISPHQWKRRACKESHAVLVFYHTPEKLVQFLTSIPLCTVSIIKSH